MILPDKDSNLRDSILSCGAYITTRIKNSNQITIWSLWEEIKSENRINTFNKYILTLDFLYAIGLLNIANGILKIKEHDK